MSVIKKLAGQTIIYGFGTIVPKLLNYIIMTPYFTRVFQDNIEEYGKITELYAYIVFLMVVLSYGMETTFFRYVNINKDTRKIFSTIFSCITVTSVTFFVVVMIFSDNIAELLKYRGEEIFIKLLAGILTIETISTIPFAKLRIEEKAKKFALYKVIMVSVNIVMMLLIYNVIPYLTGNDEYLLNKDGGISAKYIFISNLVAACIVLILLIPEIAQYSIKTVELKLIKPLMLYGIPLMISGLAGVINETLDRSIYKQIIENSKEALYDLGIYGANYKIAAVILIFIQMFRYSAEPFYFNYAVEKDAKKQYAGLMNLFVGIVVTMGLCVLVFIDLFKHFIAKTYHEGLIIIPYIIFSYVMYGILFNLSLWYKLTNKTKYAILIMSTGAIITISINIMFVKEYSYKACAIAHVISYTVMVILSYSIGRKYYKIDYNIKRILSYLGLGIGLYFIDRAVKFDYSALNIIVKIAILLLFITFVSWKENLKMIIKRSQK